MPPGVMQWLIWWKVRGGGGGEVGKRTWLSTDIAEWMEIGITACLREAENRQKWRKIVCKSHQNAPTADKGSGKYLDYDSIWRNQLNMILHNYTHR